MGVAVSVLDPDPATPAFASRYCRAKHVWDLDRAPADKSISYLTDVARGFERPAVLIPTTDSAALFVSAHAAELRRLFLFHELPYSLTQSLHSKKEMSALAQRLGIPTPKTFFPQSRQDAADFAESAAFPIMLKPIEDRHARNRTGRTKAIVHRRPDLLRHYDLMENPERPNVMLQEYIPGGEQDNWMFNGCFDGNSGCLFGLTGRKIRQNRPYAGVTSLGVTVPNAVVEETTRRFMKSIGYRGVLDIGYRFDSRDGLYKVFDVNPRVGCTFRLFVSNNGMDAVRAHYLDLTGQPVDAGLPIPGRKWMVEDMDVASSLRYCRDGVLFPREWLRSFRGVQETAYFAGDDLRPLASMFSSDIRGIFGALWSRLSGRKQTRVPWYSGVSVFHGVENLISPDLRRPGHLRS
jgi:D-aspartate ligase